MSTPRQAIPFLLLTLAAGWLILTGGAATPARAQAEPDPAATATGDAAADEPPVEEELTRAERKQQAKERRIQEYLRKKEERRAQKEMSRAAREEERSETAARQIEQEQLDSQRQAADDDARTAGAPPQPAPETAAIDEPKSRKRKATSGLPRGLERAQANVRATALGSDPTVQEYLELIDDQGASPEQLAAFGNFVGQNGLTKDAIAYYDVALRLEPDDPVLWINAGTLQIQSGNPSAAASSFVRALRLSPNNAVAHYNLGTVLHEMNKYDDAVAEYKTALTLDPTLGDPTQNPQAANNDLLLAVRLMMYQEQSGSLSVPLLDVSSVPLTDVDEAGGP